MRSHCRSLRALSSAWQRHLAVRAAFVVKKKSETKRRNTETVAIRYIHRLPVSCSYIVSYAVALQKNSAFPKFSANSSCFHPTSFLIPPGFIAFFLRCIEIRCQTFQSNRRWRLQQPQMTTFVFRPSTKCHTVPHNFSTDPTCSAFDNPKVALRPTRLFSLEGLLQFSSQRLPVKKLYEVNILPQ